MLATISTVEDIAENRQLEARDYWVEVDHPELGTRIPYPGRPFKSEEIHWAIQGRAPFIGEHNREIYGGELGLSSDDMSVLKGIGVI